MLLDDLGRSWIQTATHEGSHGEINGKPIHVCRPIDDYTIASKDPATAGKLIARIESYRL
jgi:hypothetical protein